MKLRDKTRNKAACSNLQEDWEQYKKLRNKCTEKIRLDRKTKQKKYYTECIMNNDSKKLFNLTKNRLGIKTGGPPTQFQLDGRSINKPGEIAEIQINYFTDKITKLKKQHY